MIDTSADLSTESDKFYSHNYDLEKFRQANIIGECPQWRTNVTALLHQFFVDEIQPVRFGPKEDATLIIVCSIGCVAGLNGWIWGVSLIMRITLIQRFLRSSEFVALLLLIAWLIAYNLISLVIYHQFEWREIYPADDFYILNSRDTSFVNSLADTDTRSHRQCDCKIGNGKGCDCTLPVILVMPDMKFALGVPTLLYNNQSFSCDLAKDSSS